MREPLRMTIRVHGARPHQMGGDTRTEHTYFNLSEKGENPHGPVVEHVRDGKPVTALGKKLLGGVR